MKGNLSKGVLLALLDILDQTRAILAYSPYVRLRIFHTPPVVSRRRSTQDGTLRLEQVCAQGATGATNVLGVAD